MKFRIPATLIGAAIVCGALLNAQSSRSYGPGHIWWDAGQGGNLPWEEQYDNPDGILGILNQHGAIRTEGHAFFEALGTNGRACITCHQPSNAMSISVATINQRWNETNGKDPIFAAIDGSNCPGLPQGEMTSHSLLLDRGLFRIFLAWPPKNGAEFRIEVVRDPSGCNADPAVISVYRRPRMAANLKHVTGEGDGQASGIRLMADGREPGLRSQAISAVLGHEQASVHPTAEQLRQIVDFERQIFTAQYADVRGGLLTEKDAPGLLGPDNTSAGTGGVLLAKASFAAWKEPEGLREGAQKDFRASVARGSEIFFARSFRMGGREQATCATCHSEKSKTAWMDIGTTNRTSNVDADDLPLFKITCDAAAAPHPEFGPVIFTQDPGRALVSGKCADVGAIVLQQFRGLAARPPYFSNGSARTLRDVIDFYDRRFGIGYMGLEKADLENFLKVL